MRSLTIIFTLLLGLVQAQIPTGYWRTHLSYNNVTNVEKYGDRLFGLSEGNLFYINVVNQTLSSFDKNMGLNDVTISTIKYHPQLDVLIIGYENGNIDILQDNIVYNIDDIKESNTFFGSKEIFDILPYGDEKAFVSTAVGLILLDIQNLEISESYTDIGNNGDQIAVFSSTVNEAIDSIFIDTEIGVMGAVMASSVNLKDFNNWHVFDSANDSVNGKDIVGLVSFKDSTYAATKDGKIFYYENGGWLQYQIPTTGFGEVRNILVSDNMMEIVFPNYIYYINERGNYELYTNIFANMYDVGREGEYFYIAEGQGGIKHNYYGYLWNETKNGPKQETAFHLHYYNNKIVSVPGGYSKQSFGKNYSGLGYNVFEDGEWINYGPNTFPIYLSDLVASVYNYNDNALYIATYDRGLLKKASNGNYTLYDHTNSPLPELFANNVWVTDVEMDNKGGLWVANSGGATGDSCLHVLKSDGTWSSYTFNTYSAVKPIDIVIDGDNTKWVMCSGVQGAAGLYAFNENGNNFRYLTSSTGNGGLPSITVRALIVDKENQVWVGTSEGVAVFYNPEDVFTDISYDADRPIFENRPLLREEVITAIEVDGGNRKWIGTTSGLWLFNPSGTELISHFNTENSPLFSNNILDIEIHDVTGEVFISTDAGLISYRGTASEGKDEFEDVQVFPNPITTDFDGVLTITGLVENANIKITDISGKLVYETQANGGTAVWNMRNYNDEYAKTGIYLIYAASQDGEKGYVGKVALIEK